MIKLYRIYCNLDGGMVRWMNHWVRILGLVIFTSPQAVVFLACSLLPFTMMDLSPSVCLVPTITLLASPFLAAPVLGHIHHFLLLRKWPVHLQ